MRRIRVVMLVAISTAVGCTAVSGANDFEIEADGPPDPSTTKADVSDSAASDVATVDNEQPPVIVDAEPYDAGEAGYIDVNGAWSGSWTQDFTIVGGSATMTLVQDGGAVSGIAEITGGPCPRAGKLSGSFVDRDTISGTFTSTDGTLVLNLNSTLSADRKTLEGRFQSVGACLPGAFGTTNVIRP